MDQPDGPVTRQEFFQEMGGLRGEIGGLREEMSQEIGGLRKEMSQEIGGLRHDMGAMEERLVERMRDMQTELIRVFMDYQRQNASRDATQERNTSALTERMGNLEERVRHIEHKLLLEPPAA